MVLKNRFWCYALIAACFSPFYTQANEDYEPAQEYDNYSEETYQEENHQEETYDDEQNYSDEQSYSNDQDYVDDQVYEEPVAEEPVYEQETQTDDKAWEQEVRAYCNDLASYEDPDFRPTFLKDCIDSQLGQ